MKNLTSLQALTSYYYFIVELVLLYSITTGKEVLTGVVLRERRTFYNNINSAYELSSKKI